jgi:hypothetical protein
LRSFMQSSSLCWRNSWALFSLFSCSILI